MDMDKTPGATEMFKYILMFHVLEDFFFFTTHALLHTEFLYKHVHKIHHEYNTTVSLAGLHFHIV
jgi:sterol desaturase/sphingolipid hydroxylase (fatty acid hydroxylase superfamily)